MQIIAFKVLWFQLVAYLVLITEASKDILFICPCRGTNKGKYIVISFYSFCFENLNFSAQTKFNASRSLVFLTQITIFWMMGRNQEQHIMQRKGYMIINKTCLLNTRRKYQLVFLILVFHWLILPHRYINFLMSFFIYCILSTSVNCTILL